MQKKAIFFVRNFIVGGVEKVLVSTVNILIDAGWKVTVVWTGCVDENHLWKNISPKVKQIYASKIWHLPLKQKPKNPLAKFAWYIVSGLLIYLNRFISYRIPEFNTYDYVIDFKNGSSLIHKFSLRENQTKIVWLHGAFSGFQNKQKFQKRKLFDYDKIVCLTKDFETQFNAMYPQYKNKICQIYNPFDLLIPPMNEEELKKTEIYKPFFVHVSRIDTDKDILTVLKAYVKFQDKTKSKTNLVFVGDGKQKEYFEKWVAEKGISDKVFFCGTSSFPYVWMQQAKALILSSYKEGLPTVLIEAQICKTLSISSSCLEGPAEILLNGEAGILFPVGDSNKLAEILSAVDADDFDNQKYVNCATQNLYRFNKEEFMKKFNLLGK